MSEISGPGIRVTPSEISRSETSSSEVRSEITKTETNKTELDKAGQIARLENIIASRRVLAKSTEEFAALEKGFTVKVDGKDIELNKANVNEVMAKLGKDESYKLRQKLTGELRKFANVNMRAVSSLLRIEKTPTTEEDKETQNATKAQNGTVPQRTVEDKGPPPVTQSLLDLLDFDSDILDESGYIKSNDIENMV